ncbi:Lipoprotein-releasing system transmembrane protein LolC [Lacunisphaera limnophila]|uniref:Lipoprotein-releasing system transmembrane protein LolC n=1 Tax=Lacunisphaera limnophila TaxID=1838286 RepID=A0A1I7PHF0_9BACT|nr:ABC transporter permease [Lacunisphaera limnophila]AOS43029.1 Lipoprotein-releasing system transmembrane protein LolC [Lacunisphaera limnophila]
MPWPVYLALKQLFPTGRVSFFTLISVVGVGLGVALMLVSTSVMGGFGYQIKRMIIDTQGEVQVRARSLIEQGGPVETALAGVPEVAAYSAYAQGVVMLEFKRRPAFPAVQGVDLERIRDVIPLERYLTAGSFDDLDDDSVILSHLLASGLGVRIGDMVSVYTPLMLERMKNNEVLLPREVRVAGIFSIGHQQLDSSTVICPLRLMQDLYGLDQMVHGYNVRLKPGADPDVAAAAINAALPATAGALTWFEANADFQAVLSFERNMIFFLLTFIIIVAAFSITSSLLVTVVRKTREIGLLGAMGGRAREVAASFCVQGLFIGLTGTAVGLAGGFLLLHWRNAIVATIAKFTMGPEAFVKFYQFTNLPAHTTAKDVVIIILFSVVASTLAGLIPAWRAARLKPVEALRSE